MTDKTIIRRAAWCLLACLLPGICYFAQAQAGSGLYAEPGISPDGTKIAFVSGGDIWEVAATGGTAHLIISNEADDSRPLYSPDGKWLAFVSNRTGRGDVYILSLTDGTLKRLTHSDSNEEISSWSADSKYIYFHTSGSDISSMCDVYRVSVAGGSPMVVTGDRYANEFFASPSPDNSRLAFAAKGISNRQWWRKGSSHLDMSEIWIYRFSSTPNKAADYERITEPGAREIWPMWTKDAKGLFYISDRNGNQNIWTKTLGGQAAMLTNFKDGRVLWPSIDKNSSAIVFERDFEIWRFDIASRRSSRIPIVLSGMNTGPVVKHVRENAGFSNMAVSGDGKKVAFLFHSHVFAAPVEGGGDAVPVSPTTGIENSVEWNPAGNVLVYSSWRDGKSSIYKYDFAARKETRLTDGGDDDGAEFSPDGQWISFVRNGKELHVINVKSGTDKLLHKGHFGNTVFFRSGAISWSPDSRWIAFVSHGEKALRNVSAISVSGGKPVQLSFLANSNSGNICWTPDGRSILFTTSQRTENAKIAKVDLVPQERDYQEDRFFELFASEGSREKADPESRKNAGAPAGTKSSTTRDSVIIVEAGLRERLTLLPLDINTGSIAVSNDGKLLLLGASVAGQQHLFTYPLGSGERRAGSSLRQLTSSPGMKTNAGFSKDGKTIYYLEQGKMYSMPMESRNAKPIAVSAELDVDFTTEKVLVVEQAWKALADGFYDSAFHGVNWNTVYKTYSKYVPLVKTSAELYRLMNLMIGELNSSHTGASGGGFGESTSGYLGLRFDRFEYENNGKFRITEVVSHGPADITGKIKTGDYVLAVNGVPLTKEICVERLLDNQVGKKILLSIASSPAGNSADVAVSPITGAEEKRLLYRQWVQQQREYVEKKSGGKLGYVHMYDMGEGSLNQLYVDLDMNNITKEGIVVDVRNNNGGFVNAYAIDVFARKGYMTMTSRGLPSAPARTRLGQRSFGAPTILVTNQHSLSDAEDFTEGYRTLKLGKVVGEPTGGWIIYTSSVRLIDGSSIRLPFSRITDNSGKTMELVPRPVDIRVDRPIGESYGGGSAQLDTAVKELLMQLGSR